MLRRDINLESVCALVMGRGRSLSHPHGIALVDVYPSCSVCKRIVMPANIYQSSYTSRSASASRPAAAVEVEPPVQSPKDARRVHSCCLAQWERFQDSRSRETKACASGMPSLTCASEEAHWYCTYNADGYASPPSTPPHNSTDDTTTTTVTAMDVPAPRVRLAGDAFTRYWPSPFADFRNDSAAQAQLDDDGERALARIEESCFGDEWWRALRHWLVTFRNSFSFSVRGHPVIDMHEVLLSVRRPPQQIVLHSPTWSGALLPLNRKDARRLLHRALCVTCASGKRFFIDICSERIGVEHAPGRPLCVELPELSLPPPPTHVLPYWAPPDVRPLAVVESTRVEASLATPFRYSVPSEFPSRHHSSIVKQAHGMHFDLQAWLQFMTLTDD